MRLSCLVETVKGGERVALAHASGDVGGVRDLLHIHLLVGVGREFVSDGGDAAEVGAVPADDAAKEREIAAVP
jgi:hypothetical protein